MPELDDALTTLALWLDGENIPYMVVGGFAVAIWGEPRPTHDLDITVSVPAGRRLAAAERMCAAFMPLVADPPNFVAAARGLPIIADGVPCDIMFAALPYEEAAIERARPVRLKNGIVRICAPEDLVLYKIVSGLLRDRDDIEGVFRYRRAELDYAYLDPRVEELAAALDDRTMLDWYHRLRQRWRR